MTSQRLLLNPGCLIATTVACLAFAWPAIAQNQFNLNTLEAGQLILNIDANETVSVEQDTLNVAMQYSEQNRDRNDLQNEINENMRNAQRILSETDNIDYTIQRYQVYPVNIDRNGRINPDNQVWQGQQYLNMNSMNAEALLVVTARLQQAGLTVVNMNYSLSSEKFEEVADSLMNSALQKLQARAEEAARSLNKSRAELVEVNVNSGQNFDMSERGFMSAMAASVPDAMAVPVAQPGNSQVSLRVQARALLSP
jgi:predicted secreted protein